MNKYRVIIELPSGLELDALLAALEASDLGGGVLDGILVHPVRS